MTFSAETTKLESANLEPAEQAALELEAELESTLPEINFPAHYLQEATLPDSHQLLAHK